jgi:multidrug efflux pump subunit AcrA (membrane-fusion protein)
MESYMIKPLTYSPIPENLLATVSIIKSRKENTIVLPKEAILSNETQTDYWIMKLINDTTAIKTPVQTGIQDKHKVEILSPDLTPTDKILITGNYGLPDTAIVQIIK